MNTTPAEAPAAAPRPPADSTIVEVEALAAGYGDRLVLKGVDLRIDEGEIRVVMGGSGSGKTTLLRCLLGLKEPASGTVRVLGKPFGPAYPGNTREARKRMGVAFQAGALFGSMTVGENIQLPLRQHSRLDQHTMDIMTRIKLEQVNLLVHNVNLSWLSSTMGFMVLTNMMFYVAFLLASQMHQQRRRMERSQKQVENEDLLERLI